MWKSSKQTDSCGIIGDAYCIPFSITRYEATKQALKVNKITPGIKYFHSYDNRSNVLPNTLTLRDTLSRRKSRIILKVLSV